MFVKEVFRADASAGGIVVLVDVVKCGSRTAKEHAAGGLKNSAQSNRTNQDAIREAGGIEALTALGWAGDGTTKEQVIGALWLLAIDNDENALAMHHAGAVKLILSSVDGETRLLKDYASKALWVLARSTHREQLDRLLRHYFKQSYRTGDSLIDRQRGASTLASVLLKSREAEYRAFEAGFLHDDAEHND